MITLTAEGMRPHYANVAPKHQATMAGWVNQFNDRSGKS
jgi:hypothetical protein